MSSDDRHPETRASKEAMLRDLEEQRARLDADIKKAKAELHETDDQPLLQRAAGDWRKAGETGHHDAGDADPRR